MNRLKIQWVLLLSILLVFAAFPALAKEYTTKYKAGFVGAKKCRQCHKKKKEGNQFGKWQKTRHAKAYETLATKEAKDYASKRGIDNPQQSDECLVCHITAYKAPKESLGSKYKMEMGVQCESCHGPGQKYKKKKLMRKITKEMKASGKARQSKTAKKLGLIHPNKAVCKRCHVKQIKVDGKIYKNPAYKKFDFTKAYNEIKHLRPKK